jgi:hypothetical protein
MKSAASPQAREASSHSRDTFKGRPIIMRFRWREVRGSRPHWEQAFSTDEGATWETNWTSDFKRTTQGAAMSAHWLGARVHAVSS